MKLHASSLEDLSEGAVFLATGGGGDPYVAFLTAQRVLTEQGGVDLVSVADLDDDAYVAAIGGVGAPSVGLELLPSADDPSNVLAAFEAHVGREVDALVSFEIGGGNSIIPLIAGAERGILVVDGDGMGRALPEAQMMTFPIGGVAPTPAVVMDYAGNTMTFSTESTLTYEKHVRAAAQAMGGMIVAVEHPMTGAELKQAIIPDTISFSIQIGSLLRRYRGPIEQTIEPLRAAFGGSNYGGLHHLYNGTVVDWQSSVVGGYDVGKLRLDAFDGGKPQMTIDVKNEFLVASLGARVVASVPDLIVVLDYETSTPINAERLRFGQRVAVLGIGCPSFYRSTDALGVVAPRQFGFEIDYTPVEQLNQ